ncbi:hypothetical protein CDL15_Pgr010031 [Punica granatum]|uniref:Cysteine proteinase inhibitor n=1 Tax=Punica granatum TaxID=22663 RepID=A0A218X559_PUNGR|nr:hypothetical protein CDL15_Pgr010031 [Punica granatum]
MTMLGGVHEPRGAKNGADVEDLARLTLPSTTRRRQEQVVAGTLHHLTIEAIDTGKKKLYEAKVWVKLWLNFKELQEFKHAGDVPSFTFSNFNAWKGS